MILNFVTLTAEYVMYHIGRNQLFLNVYNSNKKLINIAKKILKHFK